MPLVINSTGKINLLFNTVTFFYNYQITFLRHSQLFCMRYFQASLFILLIKFRHFIVENVIKNKQHIIISSCNLYLKKKPKKLFDCGIEINEDNYAKGNNSYSLTIYICNLQELNLLAKIFLHARTLVQIRFGCFF